MQHLRKINETLSPNTERIIDRFITIQDEGYLVEIAFFAQGSTHAISGYIATDTWCIKILYSTHHVENNEMIIRLIRGNELHDIIEKISSLYNVDAQLDLFMMSENTRREWAKVDKSIWNDPILDNYTHRIYMISIEFTKAK